jgi:hypothetical protein
MSSTLALTAGTRRTAGILLLTVAAIESGGWLMLPYLAHPILRCWFSEVGKQ